MQRPRALIDVSALTANWRRLDGMHPGQTGATIKANAYGLGVANVAHVLQKAGCKQFFVATLQEALALRAVLPDDMIAVFQGVLSGEASAYRENRLTAIVNTREQLRHFAALDDMQPAILHIDTAMGRLGLNICECDEALIHTVNNTNISHIMTHYACASDIHNPINQHQYDIMRQVQALFPKLRTSYANSAGHFLPAGYQGDVTRPGCALYGIDPCDVMDVPMQPVVTLDAPILQIRDVYEDTTLGYGATVTLRKNMRTATIALGYADGVHRRLSNRLHAYLGEYRLPLLGRVTMDALCFDVSHVPRAICDQAERLIVMDGRQTVNDIARMAGTIGYEILTGLGERIERHYC